MKLNHSRKVDNSFIVVTADYCLMSLKLMKRTLINNKKNLKQLQNRPAIHRQTKNIICCGYFSQQTLLYFPHNTVLTDRGFLH
jgi:hypothetical protein